MARSENLLARYQRIIETSLDLVSTLNLREQLHKITHAAAHSATISPPENHAYPTIPSMSAKN